MQYRDNADVIMKVISVTTALAGLFSLHSAYYAQNAVVFISVAVILGILLFAFPKNIEEIRVADEHGIERNTVLKLARKYNAIRICLAGLMYYLI